MPRSSCLLGLILLMIGCSGSAKTLPTTPVTGKVTFKGAPVASATVFFSPVESGVKHVAAQAVTDAQGSYTLKTFFGNTEKAGAVEDSYVVTILKAKPVAPSSTSAGGESPRPDQIAQDMGAKNKDRKSESSSPRYGAMGRPASAGSGPGGLKQDDSEIPIRYATAVATPLKVTVPGGTYDFDLTDK